MAVTDSMWRFVLQGVIPVADLRWILRSLGDDLTDEDIEDMINDTDTDGSGTVDFDGKLLASIHTIGHRVYATGGNLV